MVLLEQIADGLCRASRAKDFTILNHAASSLRIAEVCHKIRLFRSDQHGSCAGMEAGEIKPVFAGSDEGCGVLPIGFKKRIAEPFDRGKHK